jgi:hypothetical protein
MTKYIDGKPVFDLCDAYRQRDDDRQYITYFEAKRRDKVGRARQRALMREQSNAEADQQSWGNVFGLYKDAVTTPLKRWLYRRAPKNSEE